MPFWKSFFAITVYSLVTIALASISLWLAMGLSLVTAFAVAMTIKLVMTHRDVRQFDDDDESVAVADPQQSADELAETTERLSTVLSSMVDAVIAVDNSEHILFANPTAIKLVFDTSARDVVGRPIWEVIRNPTVQTVVGEALNGTGQQVECEIPRTKQVVSIVSTPLEGDPCPGVVLVMHDVTRLRRLEAMRRDFVSNVSHELKTPLTVIQACAETLLDGAIDDPDHNRKFLKRIDSQSERLHRLILDLLKLSHIESDDAGLVYVDLNPQQLIEECVSNHESIANTRGLELKCECEDSIGLISADHEAMHTILGNLVDNAIRYSPKGSRIRLLGRATDSSVIFQVVDNGSGIPADRVERIFERFYRVDRARSREMGGTGLGLAIVKHLTQLHQGSVVCQSRLGEGATFTVTLPRRTITAP